MSTCSKHACYMTEFWRGECEDILKTSDLKYCNMLSSFLYFFLQCSLIYNINLGFFFQFYVTNKSIRHRQLLKLSCQLFCYTFHCLFCISLILFSCLPQDILFYTVSPHCEEEECVTLTERTKILRQQVKNAIACCCEDSSNPFDKRKWCAEQLQCH
jgi:hypothetical protein